MTGSCGVLDCNISLNLSPNENTIHTNLEAHQDSMDSTSSSAPILQQAAPHGQLLDLLDAKVGESSFVHHADVNGSPSLVKNGDGEYKLGFMGVALEDKYLQVGSIASKTVTCLFHRLCLKVSYAKLCSDIF